MINSVVFYLDLRGFLRKRQTMKTINRIYFRISFAKSYVDTYKDNEGQITGAEILLQEHMKIYENVHNKDM